MIQSHRKRALSQKPASLDHSEHNKILKHNKTSLLVKRGSHEENKSSNCTLLKSKFYRM